jgi:carbon monoxide dehydrogenase subunit G
MKLSGSQTINAPRERVWAMITDVEALRTLIPGVETLEEVEPNTYKGVARIGVANIKGEYTGTVRMTDIQPPQSYQLTGEGQGKPGHVKGSGKLELVEDGPDKTTLHYDGDVQVGGPIASVGQRLIQSTAKMLVNQGLKALARRAEQQA